MLKKVYIFSALFVPLLLLGAGCNKVETPVVNNYQNNVPENTVVDTNSKPTLPEATNTTVVSDTSTVKPVEQPVVTPVKPVETKPVVTVPVTPAEKTFTLSDVAKHAVSTDCWMAVDGSVYDVSPYIKAGIHPGGEKILLGCGKDASAMFAQIHSDKAYQMLNGYGIGKLK